MKNKDAWQGNEKKKKYFEGWYYKVVTEDETIFFSLIVGVSINPLDPHAFIQVLSNTLDKPRYIKYPLNEFSYQKDKFQIQIGKNTFSDTQIKLNIKNIKIQLTFFEITKLKSTLYRPSIMGPAYYIKGLECNHGIVNLSMKTNGTIIQNHQSYSFQNGRGYIEKDYGTSFPTKYLWMQSNNAKNKDTFVLAQGKVPILFFHLTGLFLVINTKEKQYVFANYYGAKIKTISHQKKQDKLIIKQGKYMVTIICKYQKGISLPSPKQGKMDQLILEYIECTCNIKIEKKKKTIYQNEFYQVNYENQW